MAPCHTLSQLSEREKATADHTILARNVSLLLISWLLPPPCVLQLSNLEKQLSISSVSDAASRVAQVRNHLQAAEAGVEQASLLLKQVRGFEKEQPR